MGSTLHHEEKGDVVGKIDSASDEEARTQQIESNDEKFSHAATLPPALAAKVFQAPEFIRIMTPEQRLEVESRLKRKLDLRLMPMIVLMYIMNYLDRVRWFSKYGCVTSADR